MTEAGLKEDNATNRTARKHKIFSYTGYPQMMGQAREEEDVQSNVAFGGVVKRLKFPLTSARITIRLLSMYSMNEWKLHLCNISLIFT